MRKFHIARTLLLGTSGLALALPAYAQTADAVDEAPGVVVTAQI